MYRNVEKFGISDKRGRSCTRHDPYVPETGMKKPAVCRECHAIYKHKRWFFLPDEAKVLLSDPATQRVNCPACLKISGHDPQGILTLSGEYFWRHETEIQNILSHEAERVRTKNPASRIMRITKKGDRLIIQTTEQKLAEHLGRILNRAHHGDLRLDWSGSPKICRVLWQRRH